MRNIKQIPLYLQIIIGVLLGIICGLYFQEGAKYFAIAGKIFLNLLKMLIVPLILSSIITGVLSASSASSIGKLGLKTFLYYITTTLLAIVTGQILVNIVKPGLYSKSITLGNTETLPSLKTDFNPLDLLTGMIPSNIFKSLAGGNILQIIFFALLAGYFIGKLDIKAKTTLSDFFDSLYKLMMKITDCVILFAPVGIFGLLYETVAQSGTEVFKSLAMYFFTVVGALSIHFFITLPLLFFIFTKQNPYVFMKKMITPLITAFSTSSSSATLPLTIQAIETNAKVSPKISGFVLPLGATINMDGTALYECVAVIFIAQVTGVNLSHHQQLVVVVTSLLASIGAAGIPMAGLVMMSIILKAVGLPLEGVGLILAVDRFLDMFRTATNVMSDSTGTYIIAHSENEIKEN
jgi:Na+/H+-dicarboxylate symporter